MTQDEIIEMAQECKLIGMRPHLDGIYSEALVAFAKLVADKALADHAMSKVQRLGQEIEQEPVAYYHPHKGFYWAKPTRISAPTAVDVKALPLYTAPPQRTWVDLTDTQIEQVYFEVKQIHLGAAMPWGQVQFGRALLEKFKEVNK